MPRCGQWRSKFKPASVRTVGISDLLAAMNPYEWRINEIEQNAKRAANALWKLDALRNDVDSLERALRESRAEVAGLRSELETTSNRITALELERHEATNNCNDGNPVPNFKGCVRCPEASLCG